MAPRLNTDWQSDLAASMASIRSPRHEQACHNYATLCWSLPASEDKLVSRNGPLTASRVSISRLLLASSCLRRCTFNIAQDRRDGDIPFTRNTSACKSMLVLTASDPGPVHFLIVRALHAKCGVRCLPRKLQLAIPRPLVSFYRLRTMRHCRLTGSYGPAISVSTCRSIDLSGHTLLYPVAWLHLDMQGQRKVAWLG